MTDMVYFVENHVSEVRLNDVETEMQLLRLAALAQDDSSQWWIRARS
jgi:hypothetical protein